MRLCDEAESLVTQGAGVLVVDDGDVSSDRAPVPSLLAAGAVHQRLIARGLRSNTSLVVVADDARDVHHMACLLGYGADAICPRLALLTVAADAGASEDSDMLSTEAQERYHAAVEDGVLKILSKMGISTVDSYRGAQIFEVVGLGHEVVDVCFTGTTSTVGGIGWDALGEDVLARHAEAGWPPAEEAGRLPNPGYYRSLKRGGEYHAHNKEVVDALNNMNAAHLLQRALRADNEDLYEQFASLVNDRAPTELRDLLELVPQKDPIPVDEVEPVTEITRRFSTGAMSHGSLSAEAHETLAEAMNLIGGKSNCGEGGEAEYRFHTRGLPKGDKNSRIKQIASGRFGVTPQYCAYADELQIKVAQGSKPGEGGQLPGHKVSDEIALLRHTQPNVTLISPTAPRHLLHRGSGPAHLRPEAGEPLRRGLGEARGRGGRGHGGGGRGEGPRRDRADLGRQRGNGRVAAFLHHAGMPWELGLADAQGALIENGLRDRARLRIDGNLMTGRDVVMAALLGADEYSFGTAAMIAEGCIMLRACHRDTCSTGIATQRPNLRAKFTGTPEGVAAYLLFVAGEARRLLASLGMRSMDEAVGRVECLRQRRTGDPRVDSVDLTPIITPRRTPRRLAGSWPRSPSSGPVPASATASRPTPSTPCGTATTSSCATPSPTATGRSAPPWGVPSPSSGARERLGARPSSTSKDRPVRASEASSPTASSSTWWGRPTTTWARAWPAGASSSAPRRRRR